METIYIYRINTKTGLVVKIGRAEVSAESRMFDYAKQHGLSVETDSLRTKLVDNAELEEASMHAMFELNGYRKLTGKRYSPTELFQSRYIRSYSDAVKLFLHGEFETLEKLELDNSTQWKGSDLTHSEIVKEPINSTSAECALRKIVGSNEGVTLLPKYWHENFAKAIVTGSNKQVLHLMTMRDLANKFNLALKDADGNLFDFTNAEKYEKKLLSRNNSGSASWVRWKPQEFNAACDYMGSGDFTDIRRTPYHEHVFMTAKMLLQNRFSLD